MPDRPPPLLVVGAGGHGRVVLDLCRALGREVAGFLDDAPGPPGAGGARRAVEGVPVLGGFVLLDDAAVMARHEVVVAVGAVRGDQVAGNRLRRELGRRAAARGAGLAILAHPSAVVSDRASLGPGTVVCAGAVVATGARLGVHCIVNTGASVDHDCELADGVQVSPGARLAGGVRCGEDVFVGTGACVAPGVAIGARTRVGLGAGVLRDLPADVLAAGTPARAR
jgi:sugar O-acyltransferase (sialic acid O-acetyltransferase NeuD family)